MYLFEKMEPLTHPFDSHLPEHGQEDVLDTTGIIENAMFAFEAGSGDVLLTDMKTGNEKKLSLDGLLDHIHRDDAAAVRAVLSCDAGRHPFRLRVRYLSEGGTRSFEVKGTAMSLGGSVRAVGFAYDMRLSGGHSRRIAFLESHDALTGLANAAAFDAFVNDFFKFGMYPQTLIVAKIDRFTEINNAFGYNAGNTLIKNVAEVIKECFFDAEMIARIGGGEYCAVYAGKSALEIDNKIKQTRMMLHGMYMNLIKANVIFGYSSAEKAVSFCDLYLQALGKMRKSAAVRTILTESTLIDSMNGIIEGKAAWGKRHVRIQSLSAQVAAALGCGEECIDIVKVLAKIADIGFIGLDNSLIRNRMNLSGDESDAFMRHVEHGRALIGKIDELKDLRELYTAVFERYDQHPDGIPLPSRIIAGVRGFDDIASLRRAGCRDLTAAFLKTRGAEYCPEVVDAIVDVACRHYALR